MLNPVTPDLCCFTSFHMHTIAGLTSDLWLTFWPLADCQRSHSEKGVCRALHNHRLSQRAPHTNVPHCLCVTSPPPHTHTAMKCAQCWEVSFRLWPQIALWSQSRSLCGSLGSVLLFILLIWLKTAETLIHGSHWEVAFWSKTFTLNVLKQWSYFTQNTVGSQPWVFYSWRKKFSFLQSVLLPVVSSTDYHQRLTAVTDRTSAESANKPKTNQQSNNWPGVYVMTIQSTLCISDSQPKPFYTYSTDI